MLNARFLYVRKCRNATPLRWQREPSTFVPFEANQEPHLTITNITRNTIFATSWAVCALLQHCHPVHLYVPTREFCGVHIFCRLGDRAVIPTSCRARPTAGTCAEGLTRASRKIMRRGLATSFEQVSASNCNNSSR